MNYFPPAKFLDRNTPPHISTLILLAGVAALNMSIFLPSLTRMSAYFDTDYATMQFAVSGYLAATAVLQIFVGPLSDRFGRRKIVLGALAIFVISTLGALMSTSITAFLTFRILQATVATGLVLSRAIVRDMFSADESASKIGYVTMGMSLAPMIGPTIGGALDQAFDWHATFIFLSLAGLLVMGLCYFDQGETITGKGVSFKEQISSYPDLLAAPRFWGFALCAAFSSGSFFAFLGGAAYISDQIFGLSPVISGFALGVPAIGYAIGNYLTGRFAVSLGINKMVLIGTIVSLAGMTLSLLVSLAGVHTAFAFFSFCTLLGLGNGLTMPNATAGLLSVRPRLAGTASGLGGAIMIGGGAVLAQFAGHMLTGTTTPEPLQWIMMSCALLSLLAILFVIQREKMLDRRGTLPL